MAGSYGDLFTGPTYSTYRWRRYGKGARTRQHKLHATTGDATAPAPTSATPHAGPTTATATRTGTTSSLPGR